MRGLKRFVAGWLGLLCLCTMAHADAPLRVGFGSNKPPYVFEAERAGLDVDLVVAAARRAGYEVRPYFAPFERLRVMFAAGQLDAVATTNPQSGERGFYSETYILYHNAAVALASHHYVLKTPADLAEHSVSAFQRARALLGEEFASMAARNPRYREEPQQVVRNLLLLSGRVEVVVGDRRIINYFMRDVPRQVDVTQPLTWYELFPPTPYQVVFAQTAQRDRFNAGLAALRQSGEYAQIEQRYSSY
ncbi:amino acid ABC transporter substrate-binding protein, PAAT family (TC 3.A.1.3.-) [Andreprevotia lacus DSM 23236]|jgi:polar amino acid transport system substrate-binding protein|uniref:Amino acid ABC transporter substrate-binding protein, PAAT family (TC 3.A.1.3.-) n=1 Tax=Andreprevotia lacus DSM 23236 TaxID=1121001 RepID=A0A1W1XAM4_9NEIS|nr:transporter substrate-binding domain-containing protein [Andreprevotia lacus]SMC20571.1 amino acid ABC transporter substrate-binding protein, PAAT family (TC 3.A.1.3.-) [Andreprevotia lacus DSM 23236]